MTKIPTDQLLTIIGGVAKPRLAQKNAGNGVRLVAPKTRTNDPWIDEPMFGQ